MVSILALAKRTVKSAVNIKLHRTFYRLRNAELFITAGRQITCLAAIWGGCSMVCSASADPPASSGIFGLTITVSAPRHACHNAIVTVPLQPEQALYSEPRMRLGIVPAGHTVKLGKKINEVDGIHAQVTRQDDKFSLTFLIDDLPQGTTRKYRFREPPIGRKSEIPVKIFVRAHGEAMDMLIAHNEKGVQDAKLFTRYTTHSGPNKPFFYPILTPDGQAMTRRWPMEPDAKDSHEHPHHRGLWFTHGDINGIDFWSEQEDPKVKLGKTIAKGFENARDGSVFGSFRTRTEWRAPDNKLMATDVRDVRVYTIGDDRILDFEVTIKPEGEPLVWGDTKEGMFGLRVPDALAPNPDKSAHLDAPTGHIESASGLKDAAVWGKPNAWVDYYGPIGGKTYGVAIFDNPQNLRHPETWHARDYGLFTVNPFGLHDFKLGEKGAGAYTQPADQTLTFRYRLLFHAGDTTSAHVAEQYQNYSDPPQVIVK